MGEFEKNQNQDKAGQTEKNEKSAFGQLDEKGQQGQQEFGQGKQEELTGAEGKTGQQYGETKGQTAGQQGQDFAKGGQGATGQQQQDQGQTKGQQQGQNQQDKDEQQR